MNGTIEKFKNFVGLNGGKKVGRGKKKPPGLNYNHRDYRGTRGAIDDADPPSSKKK